MIKGSTFQEHITTLYLRIPSNRVSKYVRQNLIELQRETDKSTIIVTDFNIPLSGMDSFKRQKINKGIVRLHNIINQLDVIDSYSLLHPIMTENTFFSSSQEIFTKTDDVPGHKTHLNKFRERKSYNVCSQTTTALNQNSITEM